MRVLLVDDEQELLDQAKLFLEKADERLQVETTTSAEEGLKLLEEEEFDAAIADYKMPGMDGLELLEKLREKNDEIPFIILTGKGNEEVAMKALNQGADRYFEKGGDPKNRYGFLTELIFEEVNSQKGKKSSHSESLSKNGKQQRKGEEQEANLVSVKHDLKNRVQIIQGYLELLQNLDLSEKAENFVEKAMNASREIDDLIKKAKINEKKQS